MAFNDVSVDYGISGANSYLSRSGSNPNMGTDGFSGQLRSDITSLEPGTEFGMDASTTQYINQNIINRLIASTPEEQLGASAYYPLGNEPIEVGQFSGPLGSVSLMSAGAPEIPYDMLYAKQRARQKQEQEIQNKLNAQVQFEYAQVKDNIRNERFLSDQKNYYQNLMGSKFAEYEKQGIRPEFWAERFANDADYKLATQQWANVQAAFDKHYDEALGDYQSFMSGNKDKYVSPYTFEQAKNFLNRTVNPVVSESDLSDFDPTKLVVSRSIDKVVETYLPLIQPDITESILSAVRAKGQGYDIKNTDMNDVYLMVKETETSKEKITEIARGLYDQELVRYEQAYGKDGAKKYMPDFEKEFLPGFMSAYKKEVDLALEKVGKYNPVDWARLAWDKEKYNKSRTVITPNNKTFYVTGKDGQRYSVNWTGDITTSKGTGAYIPVAGVNNATIFDPATGAFSIGNIGKSNIVGYGTVMDPSGNPVDAVRVMTEVTDPNGVKSMKEQWTYRSYYEQPIQQWESNKDIAQPIDTDNPMVTTPLQQTGQETEATFKVGGNPAQTSTGPYGPTVTQGGVTYTWNPTTGQYE